MSPSTADAEKVRWVACKNIVFSAKGLSGEQKGAAWMHLTKQDLSWVERLLLVESQEELAYALKALITGKRLLSFFNSSSRSCIVDCG